MLRPRKVIRGRICAEYYQDRSLHENKENKVKQDHHEDIDRKVI